MSNLKLSNSPIDIIEQKTEVQFEAHLYRFMLEIKKLYQYEIFKSMLDLVATLIKNQRLIFRVHDQELFDLDEGNCRTIEGGGFNKFLNQFKSNKHYIITIKKISSPVIVHEVAHMLEQEGDFTSLTPFMNCMLQDLKQKKVGNMSLLAATEQVLHQETKGYPKSQVASEFFARFFQLVSQSKEVAGLGAEYGYTLNECLTLFEQTVAFLSKDFYKTIVSKIDLEIAATSMQYIKKIEDIKHKWSEEKTQSIHGGSTKPQWSRTVKSIKDNIFNN